LYILGQELWRRFQAGSLFQGRLIVSCPSDVERLVQEKEPQAERGAGRH
jgi:hypothetical protein